MCLCCLIVFYCHWLSLLCVSLGETEELFEGLLRSAALFFRLEQQPLKMSVHVPGSS
uniref:Uncharacterized protein n=1 Tax=Anguilla anguilla TaxID=7936 RepID=A0A0E9UFK4_ANGAN